MIPPPNPPLPDQTLALRKTLPLKPDPVVLTGSRIRLQPLDPDRDTPLLYARSNGQPATLGDRTIDAYDADALVWRYMGGGPFPDESALRAWLQVQLDAPDRLALVVIDLATESPVGVTNLMSSSPANLSIELGSIWYTPLVQGRGVNAESTYLMLRHVFSLGYRRVIWKCDALNERSRHSALRFGFTFEGIHEYHLIVKGRNRDTAWFRMLDREWEDVRVRLEAYIK